MVDTAPGGDIAENARADTAWTHHSVTRWLLREGRLIDQPAPFVGALGRAIVAAGAPIWRVRMGQRILDPLIGATSATWRRDTDRTDQTVVPHGYRSTPQYENSPAQHVIEKRRTYRQRLTNLDRSIHHDVLYDLAAAGGTDYFCCPVVMGDDEVQMVAFATDHPGGFSDHDLHQLGEIAQSVGPAMDIMSLRLTMNRLLETYLGRGTARQVLAGAFRRGDVQYIQAAVMYADLRDFTGLTSRLPPDVVLHALGDFFEVLVAAVHGADGEVLKFMGDAVLALFPAPPDGGAEAACAAALDAAGSAIQSLNAVSRRRVAAGRVPFDFGLTLDLGPVAYGNIGGPDRLDFTAIGASVNLVSRMQDLCKSLGERVLMSGSFAEAAALGGLTVETCGDHTIRGVPDRVSIYRPAPCALSGKG